MIPRGVHVNYRALEQVVEQPQGGGAQSGFLRSSPRTLAKLHDAPSGAFRLSRNLRDACQEEPQPALTVSCHADGHQSVVVAGSVLLEVVAEVQHGTLEDLLMA